MLGTISNHIFDLQRDGMENLSNDLRIRIIRARERGESSSYVATRFEVSVRTVQHIWQRYTAFGETAPRDRSGHRISRIAALEPTIRGRLQSEADLTLLQMCERLRDRAVQITPSALWHRLNKWKLSLKTNPERKQARAALHARRRPRRPGALVPAVPNIA